VDRHSVIGLKFLALVPVALAALLPMRVMAGLPQQAATQPTGVIAGRVVDAATGEPVAGAQVELRESGMPSARTVATTTQTTTAEGAFEFASLPAASFVLSARAEGYLLSGSGVRRPGDFQGGVALQSGERLTNLVLKLWRAGTISGTVRDESGEPVVQAVVQPLRLEYQAGERVWVMTRGQSGPGVVRTDDRGVYRLTDLQPADYIVMVPGSASGPAQPRAGAAYETGFSGGSPSARGAQVVALESGEDRTGVDLLVRYGNGAGRFPVSGRLVAPAGAPLALTVRLLPAEGSDDVVANYEELTARATSEGRFTFPGVPAGQYRLQAWQFQPVGADASQLRIIRTDGMSLNIPAQNRTGRALPPPPADPTWVTDLPVTVDKAIADLTVSLQPGARITGRVIFDGDGPRPTGKDLLKIPVVPVPALGRTLGVVPGTRIEEDGRFATVGLPPGPYVLRVDLQSSAIAGGPVWYPMPVTSGGRALIGRPIELGTSDVDVTVTFTNRLARLNIAVRDTSGRETGDARVILFARDPLMRGHGLTGVSDCVDQISVDRSGKSARPALPWCDYLAAAITNPPRLWMAPDYLESLVPFAAPANVEAGQTRTLDLVARP
jgi:hypothetical protein